MILLAIAALMGLIALALVVYPLLGIDRAGYLGPRPEPDLGSHRDLTAGMSEDERAARQALLDVDFDYRLGNLDEQDYGELRNRYEENALVGLKARYEREQELDRIIERQLAALKSESPSTEKRQAMARTVSTRKTAPTATAAAGSITGAAQRGTPQRGTPQRGTTPGLRQRRRKGG